MCEDVVCSRSSSCPFFPLFVAVVCAVACACGCGDVVQGVIRHTFKRLFDGLNVHATAQEQLQNHVQVLKRRLGAAEDGGQASRDALRALVAATKDRDSALTSMSKDLARLAAAVDDLQEVAQRKADADAVVELERRMDLRLAALERHVSEAGHEDAKRADTLVHQYGRLEQQVLDLQSSTAAQVQRCCGRLDGVLGTTDKLGVDLEGVVADVSKLAADLDSKAARDDVAAAVRGAVASCVCVCVYLRTRAHMLDVLGFAGWGWLW